MSCVVDDESSCISNAVDIELSITYKDNDYSVDVMLARSETNLVTKSDITITPSKWSIETELMNNLEISSLTDFLGKIENNEITVTELSRRYFIFKSEDNSWLRISGEDTIGYTTKEDYIH